MSAFNDVNDWDPKLPNTDFKIIGTTYLIAIKFWNCLDIFWASWVLAKCDHKKIAKKKICNEYHFNLLT